uniref:No apical meristem-associated C-terminal domain-containing protein n=1 Tax=Tanacetum cinerariifolium TaxID=118510 RepID=A0A699I8Y6_TANCI|nr:hypothetical protein [Tanacetum cinerariifolium]
MLTLFRDQNGVEFRHRDAWLFLKDKYKWTNPESTQAQRTKGWVTGEDELEMFREDAITRPSTAPRKSKSQRSSASSSAISGSSKNRLTEFFQEQIQLDREAKKESLDRELSARLAVVELKKTNEYFKILTFNTKRMNPDDAAKIEALKEKTRETFNFRGFFIVTASYSLEYPGIPVTILEHSSIGARENVTTLTVGLEKKKNQEASRQIINYAFVCKSVGPRS